MKLTLLITLSTSTIVRLIKLVFSKLVSLKKKTHHQAQDNEVEILLLLILLIRMVFEITPKGPRVDFFILVSKEVYLETFIYYLYEHVAFIIICRILYVEVKRISVTILKAFYWIAIGDLIDYTLTYNSEYFFIHEYPISYNTISFLIFAVLIWRAKG